MICPNFADPKIKKDFYSLSNIVGEDFAYYLWDKNGGFPLTTKVNPQNTSESIPNSLYENLESAFNGDVTKATLGVALTFSGAFQKKYIGFDRFEPSRQVELINEYLNNLDLSLEDATRNYRRRVNNINKTFNRLYSEQFPEVTREDLEKDPNSTVNQIEDTTSRDRAAAYEFLKANNIANKINFINAHHVVNSGAYANWTKKGLTLFRGSDYTDIYHESWHEFTQWYLSPLEKGILYQSIRNRSGEVTLGNLKIPYNRLTQRQAEEILAEEFRAYAIQRSRNQETKVVEPRIKKFFNKIYDFLDWLFTGDKTAEKNAKKSVATTFDFENVSSLFEALYEGNVPLSRRSEANLIEESLNRSTALTVPVMTDEGRIEFTLNPSIGAEAISFLSYSIYKQLRDRKVGMSALLNPEIKKQLVPELYTAVRQELNAILDKLEAEIDLAEEAGNESLFDSLSDQANNLSALITEDEAWNSLVDLHTTTSQGELFNVSADPTQEVSNNQDQIVENSEETTGETESTRNSVEYGDKSTVNPLQLYDPYVVELIKSLPDVIMVNGQERPAIGRNLGLPQNGNFQKNKNLLQNLLSGVSSYKDAISELAIASEVHPQLKYLIELLPKPDALKLTAEEIQLQTQFMQSLSMPRIEPYSVKAQNLGSSSALESQSAIQFNTFYISTLTQDALLEYLDNEFQISAATDFKSETDQSNLTKERRFVSKGIGELNFATFSLTSVLSEFSLSETSSDKEFFEFMDAAFGIDLYQSIDPQYLFDKRGNVNLNNSNYSKSQVQALTKVALATYNKIKLYDAINNLPKKVGKKLKDLIPVNVETPAKTFVEDVKKPIIDELNALTKRFQESGEYVIPDAKGKGTNLDELVASDGFSINEKKALFELLNLYHSSIKKSNNLRNERQVLFRSIENYYNKVIKSASYLNAEGNMEWSIREWQHVINQAGELNTIGNLAELTGHLNPRTNNFIGSSRLISRAFNLETGDRTVNRDGDNVLFDFINISGYSTKVEGKKTINLTPEDKLVQDLVAFLKDGVFENLRYGAKSTSLGVRTSGSRNERLFYDISKFSFNESDGTVNLDPKVTSTFRNYLKYELSRMFDDRDQRTDKEKRGFDLIILKDLVPEATLNDIKALIRESVHNKETTVSAVLELVPYFNLEFSITQYFNEQIEEFKQELAEAINEGRIEKKNKQSKSLEEAFRDTFNTTLPMEVVLADYITNYYTQQIEFVHLFVGDPSNFQIKGENWRELFKRLGASISPGKQPILSDQILDSLNNSESGKLGRRLEKLFKENPTNRKDKIAPVRDYDTSFSYVQFKDVKSFTEDQHAIYKKELIENYAEWLQSTDTSKKKLPIEAYRTKAEELLEKTIDGAEGQNKEADGQAYANLDFMRFYLRSVGEWGPKEEAAYENEVAIAEKIVQYRTKPTQELLNEINVLRNNASAGILVSQKLGYWGSPIDNPNYITLGKYSVSPLIPSVLFGTDLESLMTDMLEKGVDFATFDSGNKMSLPVSSIDFYQQIGEGDQERFVVNKIPQTNVVNFPIEGLRRQQYIAPKFKDSATLSTQLVKLMFANLYENGNISSEITKVPGLADKIDQLQKSFINNLQVVVEAEKAKILMAIGAELKGDEIVSINTQDFADWISKEFDKKDVPQSVYDYLIVENNKFTFSLDVAPHRSLFESILASALSKRVVRPKMFGEAMIQVSSLGYNAQNTRFTKPNRAQVRKYGNSGLRDYGRIVNGKHQAAEIKIAFNRKKYGSLLNLEFEGQTIETLDRLNQALLDEQWVEQNKQKITLVGVRIPVQGLNSMEHFIVKEFLPETAGPIIIVPPSLVTKSGSDFDIDKLFMYEPELDDRGELRERKSSFVENPKSVYEILKYKKKLKSELSDLQTTLENKRQKFIEDYGINSPGVKVYNQLITNNGMLIKPLKNKKSELTDEKESSLLEEITLQTISLETFLDNEKENPEIKALLSRMRTVRTVLSEYRQFSPKEIKAGASNDLIRVMSEVLSEPAIMPEFLKPNESPILKKLAEKYNTKYTKKKSSITATSIFSPLTSLRIFRENATGKKALGIDAKTNALHKLYQQVGLTYTNSISDYYLLKSNKNAEGHIILGGMYDADKNHLIADIINEFINGHVDIEKEEWINFFNADKNRTSVILQMVLNGTPIEDAVLLVNQPIIQHFLKNNKLSDTGELLGQRRVNAFGYILDGLNQMGLRKYIKLVKGKPDYLSTIQAMLADDLFTKHIKNLNEETYAPSVENNRSAYNSMFEKASKNNVNDLAAQLVFLIQYDIANTINGDVLDLTSVIDFNTASYRNLNDFHQVNRVLKTAKENFNESGLNKILQESVLSPFNITAQATSIGAQIFDLMGSNTYQDIVNEFVEQQGQYWTADQRVTEVNNFNNAIIHALIQKYAEFEGQNFYEKYGPKSPFLTKGAVGNLYSEYLTLFTRKSEVADPALKNFTRQNLFLRNFRKKDVEKTKKFYIATLTNEKDIVATNAMQQAFIEGLLYDKSTPEINQRVRSFFENVANATIVGQGFSIKYRSIHPYLPLQSLESTIGASVELRKIKDLLFTEEAKKQVEQGNEELQEAKLKLLEYVYNVKKIYTRNAYSKRVKSLNYWKYFPDYVNVSINKGAVISSKSKGLSAALSLNTAEAKKNKRINQEYPVTFRNKEYEDAGQAYEAFKDIFTKLDDNEIQNKTRLLRQIFAERFKQHLNLFGNVYDKGGADWLLRSTFSEGESFMHTKTVNVGSYIQALSDAYNDVEDEMTSKWLEAVEQARLNNEELDNLDTETEENTKSPVEQSPFEDDSAVDSDDLTSLAVPGMNLKLPTKKSKKQPEPKLPPKVTAETAILTLPLPTGLLDITFAQTSPEYLATLFPTLKTEQLEVMSKNLKNKFMEAYKDDNLDFSSICG
jgi:hypothetical protein